MKMIVHSPSTFACAAPAAAVQRSETPKPDFREVLRGMHERQAKTWEESSEHWRRVAHAAFGRDNVDAASFALVISDMAAGYAREERAVAASFGTVAAVNRSEAAL